jgi:formate hydrogenlyase transcriptional activator
MSPDPATGAPLAGLDMLRAITRQIAAAEDLQTVLQSITTALVERADAVLARVFLLMDDDECPICRERMDGGARPATRERTLHMVANAGDRTGPPPVYFHRIPLDSLLPPAVLMRTRTPMLMEDWRTDVRTPRDPIVARSWEEMGVVGVAGYPLDVRGELIGVVGYLARRPITVQEFDMLGIFADQAAIAIKNAYVFREAQRLEEQLQIERAYLQDEIRNYHDFDHVVGASPSLRAVLRKVRQVAAVDTTVLLTGDTGTGKELIARAIHAGSPRRERPMIKVNCGAIPQGMVESELFGHEKGAFTGAIQRRSGRFELADKGTLFMDEVGELPLDTQVKLLRVLQEREFERVGSASAIRVDVRLVAATHRDLEREVREGRFRADLFYRLNVFPIHIPPLRERPEDILPLARHFLAHFQRKLGKPLRELAPASLEQMRRYAWPGNVRELQNVLERACVLATGPVVELADALRPRPGAPAGVTAAAPFPTLADHERAQIRRALAAVNWRVHGPRGAAALLGVNPSTLRSRMQKLGIARQA